MDTAVILGILTLLSTVAGFVYTWMKDARDRKWKMEDAAEKSHHLSTQDAKLEEVNGKVDVVIQNGNGHGTPPKAG